MKSNITESWIGTLAGIDPVIMDDIYAFSFLVDADEDDPRRPTLTIGYNTKAHFKTQTSNASDIEEAKWNYAFWLQNQIGAIGLTNQDQKDYIEPWIRAASLYYTDQEEAADQDACLAKGEEIRQNFVQLLIQVAQDTHRSNLTQKPIIIHGLEYYDEIAKQNIKANGIERVKEFVNWIETL